MSVIKRLPYDDALNADFYDGVPADYHQNGRGAPEIKLVHNDGRETIYDGDNLAPLTIDNAAGIMGTYNYISMPPMPSSALDVGGWLNFYIRAVGHGVADVLPYKVLGGNVRGPECEVNNC